MQEDEVGDIDSVFDKTGQYYTVFSNLESLQNLKITKPRKDNLAEKRRGKRNKDSFELPPLTSLVPPIWAPQRPPGQSDDEARRVISISDPSKSSAGSQLFHACQEIESQSLGNLFCRVTIGALFRKTPSLEWAKGRDPPLVVQWHGR